MPIEQRTSGALPSPGPYLAEITNHLDSTYMGAIGVALLRGIPNSVYVKSDIFQVTYLSPFYGVTSIKYEGSSADSNGKFDDVQKSYGMWMVPPDIGTTVMVIFIDCDPNQGYWIGCVPDKFQNHMVPGIAASEHVELTAEQRRKYSTSLLPVAEFHKKSQTGNNPNVSDINKPVHPFADRLLAQGLLADTIRGITSSSARREIPSGVFGISTPGPLDTSVNATRKNIGYIGANTAQRMVPVSRLGGSSFVMDDGDVNGENELIRIRTRTGHQILMHNTQDLIYIANSKGTAWIEMTSSGKLDIYAADSVSIHSEKDFNFRADGNINLEAGEDINISAGGNLQTDVSNDFIVNASNDGILSFAGAVDLHSDSSLKIDSSESLHIKGKNLYVGATADTNISAGSTMFQTATGSFNIKAGASLFETAKKIHVNGAPATAATLPSKASIATDLDVNSLPNTSTSSNWANRYKAEDIISIMNRVPTHEPWPQHDSIAAIPSTTVVPQTSVIGQQPATTTTATSKISVTYNRLPAEQGTPPAPTGDVATDNLAAFLWMIRVCEGTSGPDGYRTMFTGALFDVTDPKSPTYQYKAHPNIIHTANGISSSAAGAYQFLSKTWKSCQATLKLPDFSPASQDKAGIFLIQGRRALDDVKAGNFSSAIVKCNREWASLPGSPYNQNPKNFNVALALYKKGGGTFVA